MHAKPDLCVFLKWMIYRSGSVITDVIPLKRNATMKRFANWLFGKKLADLPDSITLVDSNYWLDGGSTTLHAVSESDKKHLIHLNQRMIPGSKNPGRLLFDNALIQVRSDLETRIIQLLTSAKVDAEDGPPPTQSKNRLILGDDIKNVMENSPAANIEKFRRAIIEYLQSDEYLEIARTGVVANAG